MRFKIQKYMKVKTKKMFHLSILSVELVSARSFKPLKRSPSLSQGVVYKRGTRQS
jgi:hypothetical protein